MKKSLEKKIYQTISIAALTAGLEISSYLLGSKSLELLSDGPPSNDMSGAISGCSSLVVGAFGIVSALVTVENIYNIYKGKKLEPIIENADKYIKDR